MASPIVNHVSWRIGGQQGEGIDSTGDIFTKAIARYGLHLYTYRSFSSRIRGGLTFFEVRIRDRPVAARPDSVDIVLALGQEVIDATLETISEGAIILYDSDAFTPAIEDAKHKDKVHLVGVPMTKIAEANGSKIMRNMVGLGATAALLGMELDPFFEFVQERFGKKGDKVVNMNKAVLTAGRDAVKDSFSGSKWKLERRPLPASGRRLVINGNSALSFGALVGGTRFVAGYPITPATDVMEWFIDNGEDHHALVIQTEDELAAINMILGASYAGVRTLTATSGPGLSLMTEAIGLAGMAEHPVMIVDVMRPGPSTGLPTKHSQADLNFAVYGGHDDFPRIVVSPTTVEEAFYLVQHALNWMEEYQVPVFFLIDQDLAIANCPIDALDTKRVPVKRGKLLTREQAAQFVPDTYKRFEFTEDGVSTRTIPGYPNTLFLASGSESDDRGVITENRANRNRKMEKRQLKLETFAKKGPADHPFIEVHGDAKAKIGVITWGSTTSVVDEAIARMPETKVKRMAIKVLWPFPSKEVKDFMAGCDQVFVVESNFSGQLAELVKKEVGGHEKIVKITKYDGTPFRPGDVVHEMKEAM